MPWLEHGGRLRQAAVRYGIPLENWLDLSTGIHPQGWPVPAVPASVWQRLPEDDDELMVAAQAYYGTASLLPVAGSQAAIRALPWLRPRCRVGVLSPCYAEHTLAWQQAGHAVQALSADAVEPTLPTLDVLVVVNPNNPDGRLLSTQTLRDWHCALAARGGWLLVDEAFMDATPEGSLAKEAGHPGLILLRSLGKFFGLAGARVGFVLAEQRLLKALAEQQGPWTLAGPSRWVATQALQDHDWQQSQRPCLARQSQRLCDLLQRYGLAPAGGCALFQWVATEQAAVWHEHLARSGILTRLFARPSGLRLGLPGHEAEWQRLERALQSGGEEFS